MHPREIWHLPHRRIGRQVMVYTTVDSTNRVAAEHLLTQIPPGAGWAILAEEQTAGRGQHGRRWLTPAGSALLLSVLLQPPGALRRPSLLTAWAAVAVAEAISELTGWDARIKWPNDLVLDNRKVCGILVECHGSAVIVGIGLNLSQQAADWQALGLPQAVSLLQLTGTAPTIRQAAERVLFQLDALYQPLLDGHIQGLEQEWRRRLGLVHQWVRAELVDGTQVVGRLVDLCLDAIKIATPARCWIGLPEQLAHLELANQS
jgi:BirA family biotin operon repressor/biotin-[acetyl-CoA-carboxylase] ligase